MSTPHHRKRVKDIRGNAPKLSIDQLRELLFVPCENKEHLRQWVKLFWSVDLPGFKVSRYGNSTPLDAIWEVYNAALHERKRLDILFVAPRGGIKTLGAAILESLMMLHDLRGVVHVGAIENQSKRAYEYFVKFVAANKELMKPLIEKTTLEKTSLIIDAEPVTYEVLPCTMTALNGPHQPFVVMDELDTLKPEGLQAYKQINGIPVKHPITGAPPIKMGISTRKSAFGLVQQQMDRAEEQGRVIRMWNVIDMMQRCQPERHGTDEIDIYYNQKILHHVDKPTWEKLPENKKVEYTPIVGTDGCLKCPLFSVCLGDAKKQECTSHMLKPIDDVVADVRGGDADWVLAELMCLKPSIEGIVFKEFDSGRHVVDWKYMWKRLTDQEAPENTGELEFLRELHRRRVPVYAGVDFGWTAPSTLTIMAIDDRDNVYVLKVFGIKKTNDPTFIHMVKTQFHRKYRVQMYYPDVANGSGVDLMKAANLPTASTVIKSENLGVQVIKRLLNIPGTGEFKLMIAKEGCEQLVYEMERYHYEMDMAGNMVDGKFAKEFDHSIDGLRYALTSILGKGQMMFASDTMLSAEAAPAMLSDGTYVRAPNFYELAQAHAIPVNLPETKPFDKSDDDEESGGNLLFEF